MTPTIPTWAAQVWYEDGKLQVSLPSTVGQQSHRLTFPCDMQGMVRLRAMLEARSHHSTFCSEGDLSRHQLAKKLRVPVDLSGVPITKAKPKDTFAPDLRATARAVLRGLGLTGAVNR